jgi:hypothetical protein
MLALSELLSTIFTSEVKDAEERYMSMQRRLNIFHFFEKTPLVFYKMFTYACCHGFEKDTFEKGDGKNLLENLEQMIVVFMSNRNITDDLMEFNNSLDGQ